MINVLLCGICGLMGKRVYIAANNNEDINVVCGVDKNFKADFEYNCPVYSSFSDVTEMVDVVIDFSCPDAINDVLDFVKANKCALVVGTSGYSSSQMEAIEKASQSAPIFLSTNISLGVNTLFKLCKSAALQLKDFDVEIIEEHEALKSTAPSRTSVLLANAINEVLGTNRKIISGRKSNQERGKNEICIHSIRGGGIAGETQIMFIGEMEIITLTHRIQNKTIFANGALDIAKFIKNKQPGTYNLGDYFKE